MRNFIFALAIATPAFAYAQTPTDLTDLAWNGAAAPAETSSALLPVPSALTAADVAALQFPLGVVSHSVNTASVAVSTSKMTGADLVRLRGRTLRTPIITVQDLALANTGTPKAYR